MDNDTDVRVLGLEREFLGVFKSPDGLLVKAADIRKAPFCKPLIQQGAILDYDPAGRRARFYLPEVRPSIRFRGEVD